MLVLEEGNVAEGLSLRYFNYEETSSRLEIKVKDEGKAIEIELADVCWKQKQLTVHLFCDSKLFAERSRLAQSTNSSPEVP